MLLPTDSLQKLHADAQKSVTRKQQTSDADPEDPELVQDLNGGDGSSEEKKELGAPIMSLEDIRKSQQGSSMRIS